MDRDAYLYTFKPQAPFREALATLDLALIATESIFGEARTHLDARSRHDAAARTVEIDASTPAGQTLNEIFVGYAAKEFGLGAFTVVRVPISSSSIQ